MKNTRGKNKPKVKRAKQLFDQRFPSAAEKTLNSTSSFSDRNKEDEVKCGNGYNLGCHQSAESFSEEQKCGSERGRSPASGPAPVSLSPQVWTGDH